MQCQAHSAHLEGEKDVSLLTAVRESLSNISHPHIKALSLGRCEVLHQLHLLLDEILGPALLLKMN